MEFRKQAAEGIVIADCLSGGDVDRLREEGFATVLDLRDSGERMPEGVLEAGAERRAVGEAGMRYENVPVRMSELSQEVIERAGELLREAEKPVLVHCATGRRAGAVTLMNLGVECGMIAEECLAVAERMGFDCESQPEMKRLVIDYMKSHSPAYGER